MTVGSFTVALSVEPPRTDRTQWVHYLPSGAFGGRDSRGPWRLADPDAFIAASFARLNGQPIPVDYDHALVSAAENRTPAPAAGWITRLEARPEGIWGLTEWTPRAASHIAAREYRFVSPVFFHTKDGDATALKAAALTNQPALDLTAICSMESPQVADLDQLLSELRPLLGLTDAAGPDAIVEAVQGLKTRLTAASMAPSPDKFVPIEQFEHVVAAFNAQNRGVSAEAAELAVCAAIESGKLMPGLKEWGLQICSANKPAFDAFLERTSPGTQTLFTRIAPIGAPPAAKLDPLTLEIGARMGLSADDFSKAGA